MRKINIGLSEDQLTQICDLLNHDLADAYLLVIKTKKYHWDVVGPQFRTLHEMLEEQYQALSENVDAIAERVRTLGGFPLGTAEGFLKHSSIQEHPNDIPNATEIVARLSADHEQIVRNMRKQVDQLDEELGDKATADFLIDMIQAHEEMAWMLRSFLDGESLQPTQNVVKEAAVTVR